MYMPPSSRVQGGIYISIYAVVFTAYFLDLLESGQMAGTDDDGIGYGRPPLHSRFKPGESGNPRGRPKGAASFKSDLLEELSETIAVREGSGEVRITKQTGDREEAGRGRRSPETPRPPAP